MKTKTICAISTPLGSGGISVIRLSGEKALNIMFRLFSNKQLNKNSIEPRKMYLGDFQLSGAKEKCLMVYFKAPASYTGEDLVEFQCHGGIFLAQRILETLLANGAVLAENGEFTKRAFLNGKMSLDQVEGVADIINATSDAEVKSAFSLIDGKLYEIIKKQQNKLLELLSELEVSLDYPEHDIEYVTLDKTKTVLNEVEIDINSLVSTQKQGKYIQSGINCAIIGKTNVGKSSLLNALLGTNRAIVTDIEGTTRDTICESIVYKGIKINFIDTAGIRESNDTVEIIGIDRSKHAIKTADIVLFVMDSTKEIDIEEKELLKEISNKPHLTILNKIDISKKVSCVDNAICVSAQTGENIELIKQKIYNSFIDNKIQQSEVIITNIRQAEALKEVLANIEKAKSAIKTGLIDITTMEIKAVWKSLGKITGETENEQIVKRIFEKFCLGK